MRKFIIGIATTIGISLPLHAQQPLLEPGTEHTILERITDGKKSILTSDMNLQFCTSAAADFNDGNFEEAAFKLDAVRLEILGSFLNKFSYQFRQSFNKEVNPHVLDNLSSSVECALVNWDIKPHFRLTVGKQAIQLGGYEYWVNAIKVREFSDFNNTIACYQAGINGSIQLSPTQQINLQVVNNRNGKEENVYAYGRPKGVTKARVPMLATANWDGYFFDKGLNLRYSASWGQLANKRNIFYLTAGNVWERGPVVAYWDLMYSREGLDNKGLISKLSASRTEGGITAQHVAYFTTIANVDYRFHPHWNAYAKGAYETGSVYQSNSIYEKGLYRRTWSIQACLEFLPLEDSELRIYLHLRHQHHGLTERAKTLGAESNSTQRLSLGLVYTIPVF